MCLIIIIIIIIISDYDVNWTKMSDRYNDKKIGK